MIYLDSSIVLARLFAEDRSPPDALWSQSLISSRLLEYEVLNRVHARAALRAGDARQFIDRVNLLDLSSRVLARAPEPFPLPVCTLDGLHLATINFLRAHGQIFHVASYDQRLAAGAEALGFPLAKL